MATTYNYNTNGYPKFRLVVDSVTITNRTATSAKVNYKVTASINGWYHYDLKLTISCGNNSKSHKLNPWGTKNDNSNVYRDSRTLTGSFTITGLSTTSSNPGVKYTFSSSQNSHGNVTFGSTTNGSKSSVKVPAYTGSTTKSPSNAGSGNDKNNNNNKNNNGNSPSGSDKVGNPDLTISPSGSNRFADWKDDATDQGQQWAYDNFLVSDELNKIFNKLDQENFMYNALTGIGGPLELEDTTTNAGDVNKNIFSYKQTNLTSISDIQYHRSGIFGTPFQFNDFADVKDSKFGFTTVGRTYSRYIWNNLPIVHFEVGKPYFMDSMFGAKKSSISNYLTTLLSNVDEDAMATDYAKTRDLMLGMGGLSKTRYYTFMDDFYEYSTYVNTMVKYVALSMGLGSEKCPLTGRIYRDFDIKEVRDDSFWGSVLTTNYISFCYNPTSSSISESGSNSVGESVMSTMFSNVNSLSREVQYLFGVDYVTDVSRMDENSTSLSDTVSKLAKNLGLNNTGLMTRLNSISSCISGANILFPYIWQDSQFTKTYSLNFKFSSPYGDPECILINVYIPYLCLLAMAMPKQASTQGYKSPFIIKASSKGWFNCDIGMVESIDIKRGGPNGDQWTVDGLPTEIEINMTLKDLYPVMMATSESTGGILFSCNSAFADYLTMMSGIEMHVITPGDKTMVLLTMLREDIKSIPETILKKFKYNLNSYLKFSVNKFFN